MSYRSDRFNRSMMSLEQELDRRDLSKAPELSDRGESAARMFRELDERPGRRVIRVPSEVALDTPEFVRAISFIELFGKNHLRRTLGLIVRYGNDLEKILRHVSRPTYFRHRAELLKLFS